MYGWLREPLLHFTIIGAMIFALHAWRQPDGDKVVDEDALIVRITAQDVDWLSDMWARQWHRSPTQEQLRVLVSDYLKEELLAHEAQALGLAENDTIVRRRLAQKMTFLVQDTIQLVQPDEAELRRLYEASRERYQSPGRIWFTQIYFRDDTQDEPATERIASTFAQLSASDGTVDLDDLGDRTLLERTFAGEDRTAIANLFGEAFAQRLFAVETGRWVGPIESGYGLHLVRIDHRQEASDRDFAAARDEVLDAWRQQQQQAADEQYFAALLAKYSVEMDERVRSLLGPQLSAKAVQP